MKYLYQLGGTAYPVELVQTSQGYRAQIDDRTYEVTHLHVRPGELHFQVDGVAHTAFWAAEGARRWVAVDGTSYVLRPPAAPGRRAEAAGGHAERSMIAPMPGQVRAVEVKQGELVEKGQTLILLEAMKMEIRIQAALAGRVARLLVAPGQTVEREQLLIELE